MALLLYEKVFINELIRLKNLRAELGFKNVIGMNALPSNDDAVRSHNVKMKYENFDDD